jgi:D,D-heptose 1,7-bisphosphate phosphatase
MSISQAVILVGGLGTRLGALAQTTPKPMLEVAGRPFVEHVIAHLSRFGVSEILLLAGFRGDAVKSAYDGRIIFGTRISVAVEPEPLGTAGALAFVADRLAPTFFMANGDTFFDTDLTRLLNFCTARDFGAAFLVRQVEDGQRYGQVECAGDGHVTRFREKSSTGENAPALINAGLYLVRRDAVLPTIEKSPCSFETDILPRLLGSNSLYALEAEGYFVDIGIPSSLESARAELLERRTRPTAFMDRDGVLNIDRGYTHRASDLVFVQNAPQAVRRLNDAGFYVFVVSNQGGIARGYYDEDAARRFNSLMQTRLLELGAHIDGFYFCPHHPAGSISAYTMACNCRKPAPGLFEEVARDWPIDRAKSFMIGDTDTDIDAAQAFGIRAYKFENDDLLQAVERILEKERLLGLNDPPGCVPTSLAPLG